MSENRSVLYVGGFELPDKNAAAQRVIANSLLLKSLGYKVTLLGTNRKISSGTDIYSTKSETAGFTSYSFPYPVGLKNRINFLTGISYLCIAEEVKPQIIIAYNYPAIALYRLKYYCHKRGIRLVADSTEWYALRGNILFRVLKGIDNSLRMRFVHRRIDGVIAISSYLYDFYAGRNMPVVCLPPLVDKMDGKWQPVTYIPDNERIRLVYAGSPGGGHKDRLDRIVGIVNALNKRGKVRLSLQIVGVSRDEYLKAFGDTDTAGRLQNIEFAGRLSHHETLNFLKRSDFQLILRDNNIVNRAGFPTKLVESIACGTPVIANRFSNIADYIETGKNGFLIDDSGDESLISSLEKILNISRNTILVMKDYCFAYNIFDYRLYEKQLADFLLQVTNRE